MPGQSVTENSKFVEMINDSRFPAVTCIQIDVSLTPSPTAYNIFSKYAVLTYNVGASFTSSQTLTAGAPTFVPTQVQIYNPSLSAQSVTFTLISGNTATIWTPAQQVQTLNLAVSAINTYNGCTVTILG